MSLHLAFSSGRVTRPQARRAPINDDQIDRVASKLQQIKVVSPQHVNAIELLIDDVLRDARSKRDQGGKQ